MNILDYEIFDNKLDDICIDNRYIINTINPHSYVVAKKDNEFMYSLLNSDILLPDGIGIVFAILLLRHKKIKKIAGYDVFTHLMKELNKKNGSCFFLGASKHTLELIKQRSSKEFPHVKVNTFSPPYKDKFSKRESEEMCEKINNCNPDVLFIGMTAPKQEKWAFENKEAINSNILCSIGAVFDFYAETVKRPHKIWIFLCLEWFIRFLKNPRRMWRRYIISNPIFIKDILLCKIKIGLK